MVLKDNKFLKKKIKLLEIENQKMNDELKMLSDFGKFVPNDKRREILAQVRLSQIISTDELKNQFFDNIDYELFSDKIENIVTSAISEIKNYKEDCSKIECTLQNLSL